MIKFRDLDEDGDIDLYFSSGSIKTNGIVLLNQGDFAFEFEAKTIAKFTAQELMDEILEEADDKVSLPVIKEKTSAEIAAQELMDEILEELEAESSQ